MEDYKKVTIWDNGNFAASFSVEEHENVLDSLEERLFFLFDLVPEHENWRDAFNGGNIAMFHDFDTDEKVCVERDGKQCNNFYLYHASARFNERHGFDIMCRETGDTLHVMSSSEARRMAEIYAAEERENSGCNQQYDIVNSDTGEVVDYIRAYYDIEEANFSVRTFNVLIRAGIRTRKQLLGLSFNDMRDVKNMGWRSIREVLNYLAENGQAIESM